MTGRRVAVAAAVAALLVVAAVLLEVVLPRRQARLLDERTLLLEPGGELSSFVVEHEGETLRFASKDGGGWRIETRTLKDVPADIRAVQMVTEALAGARVTSEIGAASELPLASYGLQPPRATLSWTRGDGKAWLLALGSPSLGGQVHAQAGDRVVLVPERILVAADRGLDHFRAKRVLQIEPDQIARIEIVRRADQIPAGAAGKLVLEHVRLDDEGGEEWRLVEPLPVPANGVRVQSLLSRVSSLMALGFGPEQPTREEAAERGLDQPVVALGLTLRDGTLVPLLIGTPSPAQHAWARSGGGPVVEIREDLVRDLLLPEDFWRDNRVLKLPLWRLVTLRILKGSAREVAFEMQREPDGPWHLVPGGAAVDELAATGLLEKLEDLQCGRFENELARDPERLMERWDFGAEGAVQLQGVARLKDGTERRADAEMTLFVRERTPYFGVRMADGEGRMEACVAMPRAVDALMAKAREIRDATTPPGPPPGGATGP